MNKYFLTKEYEYLAEDHYECQPEVINHSCYCFFNPPCGNCENCPAYIEEAWYTEETKGNNHGSI